MFEALAQSQVLDLLSHMHQIPPKKRGALLGRLQHLQRHKFPAGVNTGRGKPAKYDETAILRLLLVFEMLQFGLGPEKCVQLLKWFSQYVVSTAGYGALMLLRGADPDVIDTPNAPYDQFVLLFDPHALATLSDEHDEGEMAAQTIASCELSNLPEVLETADRRSAYINTTRMIGDAALYLRDNENVSCAEFGRALMKFTDRLDWSPE